MKKVFASEEEGVSGFSVHCLPNRKVGFVTFFYDFQMHYACILNFFNVYECFHLFKHHSICFHLCLLCMSICYES